MVSKKMQFSSMSVIAEKLGGTLLYLSLLKRKVLLVNVYAPNFDEAEFAPKLFSRLYFLDTNLLIFGGDLYCVLGPLLGFPLIKINPLLVHYCEKHLNSILWGKLFLTMCKKN